MKKNQKGFSAVEGLLILVIVCLISFVGWFVWQSKHKLNSTYNSASNSVTNSPTKTNPPAKTTHNWYLYTSKDGKYKIKLADGLTFKARTDSPFMYTLQPITLGSGPAKVIVEDSAKDASSGLFIDYAEGSSSNTIVGDKQMGFKTQSGLDVTKYYYLQANDIPAIGGGKGSKEYTYIIMKGNNQLHITYDLDPSQVANTDLVEQMVKTVQLP